jgi:enamine deaminase RidA (YjgF/YER057c/UK114 family)
MRLIPAVALAMLASTACYAQSADSNAYKREGFNYSEWAKGKFSEVVSVQNAKRTLYLGGVGSEDENSTGSAKILYPGDMYAQCKYAWDKVKRILEKQGAGLENVVRSVTYMTDIRYLMDGIKCRSEIFGSTPQPAGTLVGVTSLAWPGMMFEVEVVAELPK